MQYVKPQDKLKKLNVLWTLNFETSSFKHSPTCLLLYLHEECYSVELNGWDSGKQSLVVVLPSWLQKCNRLYFISTRELPRSVKLCIYLNICRHMQFVIITALDYVWECNWGYRTLHMNWEAWVQLLALPCKLVW